jgi:hypothetical protein
MNFTILHCRPAKKAIRAFWGSTLSDHTRFRALSLSLTHKRICYQLHTLLWYLKEGTCSSTESSSCRLFTVPLSQHWMNGRLLLNNELDRNSKTLYSLDIYLEGYRNAMKILQDDQCPDRDSIWKPQNLLNSALWIGPNLALDFYLRMNTASSLRNAANNNNRAIGNIQKPNNCTRTCGQVLNRNA